MSGSYYEVVVKGRTPAALAAWSVGIETCSPDGGCTRLFGWFEDRAALEGLIAHIGDLGLELVSVRAATGQG